MRRGSVAVVLSLASLLTAAHVAMGNGPEVGRDAGMILPVASDSIQLVSEQVRIKLPLHEYQGTANCTYVLRNLAATAASFEMAFATNPPFDPTPDGYRRQYREARFVVALDGAPIEAQYAAVAPGRWSDLVPSGPDSVPVWRVALGPRATAEVTIQYAVSWSGGGEGGHTTKVFTYYARPAALWAGVIESADIQFDMGMLAESETNGYHGVDSVRVSIEPAGYVRVGTAIHWHFTNWEPSDDLSFRRDSYGSEL